MGKVHVSNEVWAQLDPRAAVLSRAARMKVALWGLVAAAVIVAALVLTASGLFIHRFTIKSAHVSGSFTSCRQTLAVKNNGWFDDHIAAVSLQPHGSGARLTRNVVGLDLPSGGTLMVRLHYDGPVCRQLLSEPVFSNGTRTPPELSLQLRRPWGVSTTTIRLAPPPSDEGLNVRW
jgi:hypothetical protein